MNWMSDADYHAPRGMVSIRPGDVLMASGQPHIAVMVNDCRARLEPLTRKHISYSNKFGEQFEFDAPGNGCNISVHCEPEQILERRGQKGADDFLAARKAKRNGGGTNNNMAGKGNSSMAAKPKDKTKMRGGLAAEKAQDEAAPTAAAAAKAGIRTKGGLGEVMGFAVTSVMRRLGKEGCSVAHVLAILKANKVTPSKATANIQVNAGKKGQRGEPAPLTKDQVAELKAMAPEPAEQAVEKK